MGVCELLGAGEHDVSRLGWRYIGVERAQREYRDDAADELGDDEAGHRCRSDPGEGVGNVRPIVIAGFAKLAELVKK